MDVSIKIIYLGFENEILRSGSFKVNPSEFKKDPDCAVANVTFNWIKKLRLESNVSRIIKVVYNGDKVITDLVVNLDSKY